MKDLRGLENVKMSSESGRELHGVYRRLDSTETLDRLQSAGFFSSNSSSEVSKFREGFVTRAELVFFQETHENLHLTSLTLGSLEIRECSFQTCSFRNTDMRNSTISKTDFIDVDFSRTILVDAKLRNCAFGLCDFRRSDLTNTDFSRSEIIGCDFTAAKMAGTIIKTSLREELMLSPMQKALIDWRE